MSTISIGIIVYEVNRVFYFIMRNVNNKAISAGYRVVRGGLLFIFYK